MSGVEIRIRANARQAQGEISKLENSLLNLEKKVESTTRTFKNLAGTITAVFLGGQFTRAFSAAENSLTEFENRIALVTGAGIEARKTLESLYDVAAASRTPVNGAIEVFNRFGLALKDSGVNTEELLGLTETIQKAVTISGASAESANAALIQLGQGIASGQLRGQELNSVLEQTPRIAQAIADGLQIPFGELRKAAEDGQLTAERVLQAIASQANVINEEFGILQVSVSSASVVLRNEFTKALAEVSQYFGFGQALVSSIEFLTNGIYAFRQNFEIVLDLIKVRIISFRGDIQQTFANVGDFISAPLITAFDSIKDKITGVPEAIRSAFTVTETINTPSGNVEISRLKTIQELFSQISGEIGKISFEIVPISLEDAFPSLDQVKTKIREFADTIVNFFKYIYDSVVGNSYWGELFWEGANRIGGPKFVQAITYVINTITSFKDSIVKFFGSLYENAKIYWGQFTDLLTSNDFTSGVLDNIKGSFDSITAAIKSATESTVEFVKNFGTVTRLEGNLLDSTAQISERPVTQNTLVSVVQGAERAAANLAEYSRSTYDYLSKKIEENSILSGIIAIINSGATRFTIVLESAIDIAKEYKDAGVTAGTGFLETIREDANLMALLTAGAGAFVFREGLSGAPRRAIQLTGVIAALEFGPDVLQSETFQNLSYQIGEAIGSAITLFAAGEEDGKDYAAGLINGINLTLQSIGKGILDGLEIPEEATVLRNSLSELLLGAAGAAATGFIFAPESTKKIISAIGSSFGILTADNDAVKNLGTKFSRVFKLALVFAAANTVFEISSNFFDSIGIQEGSANNLGASIGATILAGIAAYFKPRLGLAAWLGVTAIEGLFSEDSESLGSSIAAGIGAAILATGFEKDLITAARTALGTAGQAGILPAVRQFGLILATRIGAIVSAPAAVALIAAGLGIAVGKAFTYFSNQQLLETNAQRAAAGMGQFLTAGVDKAISESGFSEHISQVLAEETDPSKISARIYDPSSPAFQGFAKLYSNGLIKSIQEIAEKKTSERGIENAINSLIDRKIKVDFPAFEFDRQNLFDRIFSAVESAKAGEPVPFDIGEFLAVDNGKFGVAQLNAAGEQVVADTEKTLEELKTALLETDVATAAEAATVFIERLRDTEVFTQEQFTQLDTASEKFDTATLSMANYIDKLKEIGSLGDVKISNVVTNTIDSGTITIQKRASGGYISGPGGPTDDLIPAMLSNGEFVVKASSVNKFGLGFFQALNAGFLPRFSVGGVAKLKNGSGELNLPPGVNVAIYTRLVEELNLIQNRLKNIDKNNEDIGEYNLRALLQSKDILENRLRELNASSQTTADNTSELVSSGESGSTKKYKDLNDEQKAARDFGINTAVEIREAFKGALSQTIKTGDFKSAAEALLDQITSTIIDSFVDKFVDGIFESLVGGQDSPGVLSKFFEDFGTNSFNIGKELFSGFGNLFSGFTDMFSGLFTNLTGMFSNVFSGLIGGIGNLFSGMFGGIGSLFGGFGGLFSIFGFSQGGIVPSIGTSRTDIDSVPAMLTPGELVVPADKVDSFLSRSGSSQQTVFNLNITGDISRQTRTEILKMIPEITSGVNYTNKENNYRMR